MKLIVLCLALGAVAWRAMPASAPLPAPQEKPPTMKRFEHDELPAIAAELKKSGQAWKAFLERKTMTCGVYRLKAGADDGQSPHTRDEVYYVVEGKSKLTVEDEVADVKPGDVLFVAAHAEHRFHDITADLTLLVFFSSVPVPKEDPLPDDEDG